MNNQTQTPEPGPDKEAIRQAIRRGYGKVAQMPTFACGCSQLMAHAGLSGYSPEELKAAPAEANLGLGCGNPVGHARLKPGETVVDLGSGGGFDSFLAASSVGAHGKVIGVDMTPEMITKARMNAKKAGVGTVEFRLGEIESLPVESGTIDVIISNCVINLSPEKDRVFQEAFRVLKPGGRLCISDVIATAPLPPLMQHQAHLYARCIAGVTLAEKLEAMIRAAGFTQVKITPKDGSLAFLQKWVPGSHIQDYIASALIEAVKPDTQGDHPSASSADFNQP